MTNSTSTFDMEAQAHAKRSWRQAFERMWRKLVQRAGIRWSSTAANDKSSSSPRKLIEDYPKGYPRFSRLIGSDVGFALSRRFSVARARLLLNKQDRVSQLERKLEDLDQDETRSLFLGSMRRDQNPNRQLVLRELDDALADYDALLERSARILRLPEPAGRHTTSLSNWVNYTGSICRKEAAFLEETDLCALQGSGDEGISTMERYVERFFVWSIYRLRKPPPPTVSRDPRVFVFKGSARAVTRILFAFINVTLLLVPVIVIRSIQNPVLQIFCTLVASVLFILVLSGVLNARTAEIFAASPTYAALLAVFVITRR